MIHEVLDASEIPKRIKLFLMRILGKHIFVLFQDEFRMMIDEPLHTRG